MTGTREPGVVDRFPCQDDAEAEGGVLGGTCDHDEQCIRIRRGLGPIVRRWGFCEMAHAIRPKYVDNQDNEEC